MSAAGTLGPVIPRGVCVARSLPTPTTPSVKELTKRSVTLVKRSVVCSFVKMRLVRYFWTFNDDESMRLDRYRGRMSLVVSSIHAKVYRLIFVILRSIVVLMVSFQSAPSLTLSGA